MPEGIAFGGFDSFKVEVVDVSADAAGDLEVDGFFVGSDGDGVDDWRGGVDLGAAVVFLVDVGPGGCFVGGGIFGGGFIDGFGEGDGEAIGLGVHFVHFERRLARPANALKGEVLASTGGPAAVGSSDEEGGVLTHAGGDNSATEVFEEFPNGTLIEAFDFFHIDALDLGVGLLADETWFWKGPNFPSVES